MKSRINIMFVSKNKLVLKFLAILFIFSGIIKCKSVSTEDSITSSNISPSNSCIGDSITRSWGRFTDCNNGTIKLVIIAGNYGGNYYNSKTIYFSKCSYGQTYDPVANSCSATTTSKKVQYCNVDNNSCNGGTNSGILDGNGVSEAYLACSGYNLANKSWRVPTLNELKLLIECKEEKIPNLYPTYPFGCENYNVPSINNLFPNTLSEYYWSSSGRSSDTDSAWMVNFVGGNTSSFEKHHYSYLRCIADE